MSGDTLPLNGKLYWHQGTRACYDKKGGAQRSKVITWVIQWPVGYVAKLDMLCS